VIIEKTSTIGEKISLRRFEVINKINNQSFGSYLHMGGKIASLIVVENANEEVANEIAMQTTAMKPSYIRIEDITKDVIEHETKVLTEQTINEGKPKEIAEKMVIGRLNKFYKEICLEEQSFIKDDSLSVKEYVKNNGGKVITMIRYEVGEGMEKRNEDFAEEVMKQVNN
jgi:elongation factor Ts